jgi:tetratricopeptide (TPR) repeat protein
VLIFQNLIFTKGKRRILLFVVLKAEGDIFQELRDFDKAIKSYKALATYCEIWQLKEPHLHLMEQIALCYRLMRVHGVAVDFFKKELQHAWQMGDKSAELDAYNHLATEYYYIGDF